MNINFFKKLNKTMLSILLFLMTYSFSYSVTYNFIYDDECTTVTEYVAQMTEVVEHGDLCDTQKQFHNCFIIDIRNNMNIIEISMLPKNDLTHLYIFELSTSLLKPPIA